MQPLFSKENNSVTFKNFITIEDHTCLDNFETVFSLSSHIR